MDDPPLVTLALRIACRPTAGLALEPLLTEVASEIAAALDVAGVVIVVPQAGCVAGSDETATLVGQLQLRAGQGPLPTAARTSRPMLVPDLRRVGPPSLAALAADTGLVSAAATVLQVGVRQVGVLQVLGTSGCVVGGWHLDMLGPVLGVLAARIADVLDFQALGAALERAGTARAAVTGSVPVPAPRRADPPGYRDNGIPPRHRRSEGR